MRTAYPSIYEEIETSPDEGFEVKIVGEFCMYGNAFHPESTYECVDVYPEEEENLKLTPEQFRIAKDYCKRNAKNLEEKLFDSLEVEDLGDPEPPEPDYDTLREEQEFRAKQDGSY